MRQSRFTLSHSLPYLQFAFHGVLYLLYFLSLIRHLKCHHSLIQTDFALRLPACAPRSILEKPSPFSSAIATSKEPVIGDFLPLYSQSPNGTRPLRRPTPGTQGFHYHPRSSECHRLPQKRRLQVAKASYPFPNPLQLNRVLRIGISKKHTDPLGEHAMILSSVPRAEEPQETYRYHMARIMEIHNGAN